MCGVLKIDRFLEDNILVFWFTRIVKYILNAEYNLRNKPNKFNVKNSISNNKNIIIHF